jgi:tetratricopeptide (TPR) repeat protein
LEPGENRETAREIAVELLSGLPLAIVIAASPRQKKRYTLDELKKDLQKRVNLEFGDDQDNVHRSMSAALSLARSGVEASEVSAHAKKLWAMLAQYPGEFSNDLFSLASLELDKNPDLGKDARLLLKKPDFGKARFLLRDFSLLVGYKMLEPVKNEEFTFEENVIKASRGLLFATLSALFVKGDDIQSPDRQKWHEASLACLQAALKLLSEATADDFDGVRRVVHSALNYYQYSSYASLETLRKLEELYGKDWDNLGLANVLKAKGDLESRLGEIEAAQKHYGEAEALYREARDNLGLANVFRSMGDLEMGKGANFIPGAIERYTIALGLYEKERTPMGRIFCLAELCLAYATQNDKANALEYVKAALEALGTVDKGVAEYVQTRVRAAMDIIKGPPDNSDGHL